MTHGFMNSLTRNQTTVLDGVPPGRESRFPVPNPIEPRARVGRYVVVAGVLLVGAFVIGLLPRLRQHQSILATTRELAIPSVTVVSPKPSAAGAPVSLAGEIRPYIEAPIYARATGYVRSWSADLGASVTNGQIIAELDTPELAQDLANGRAQLRQSEAAAALAVSTSARWAEMLNSKLVSQQEADEKRADATLKEAMVESARANVHRLEDLIGFSHITAPFDGIVTSRRLDVGQLVAAGNGAELFRLAQTRTLRIFVRVPQTLARNVAIGQTAEVALNGVAGSSVTAKVVRTAGALDAASRTLLTELELPNPNNRILPGSYVQVRFLEANGNVPLTVPSNTLLFRPEGTFVGVVKSGEEVELRSVELGRDLGAAVEIVSGVTAEDRLVLNPPDSLANGARVRVVNSDIPGRSR